MPDLIIDKAVLRRALLAKRQAIAQSVRREWDAAIGERILACPALRAVQTLGVYWPIRGEPDLRPIYPALAAQGLRLALPVVVDHGKALRFAAWRPGDALARDAFGVAIPAVIEHVEPDALLIPCVGFNAANLRLGYGGGFYDRTLAAAARPLALGIAYRCCAAEFAGDAHDVALDAVITETPPADVQAGEAQAL